MINEWKKNKHEIIKKCHLTYVFATRTLNSLHVACSHVRRRRFVVVLFTGK